MGRTSSCQKDCHSERVSEVFGAHERYLLAVRASSGEAQDPGNKTGLTLSANAQSRYKTLFFLIIQAEPGGPWRQTQCRLVFPANAVSDGVLTHHKGRLMSINLTTSIDMTNCQR